MLEQIVKWTMCALMAYGALSTIANVGKPRGPLTGRTAAIVAGMQASWIAAILTWWD